MAIPEVVSLVTSWHILYRFHSRYAGIAMWITGSELLFLVWLGMKEKRQAVFIPSGFHALPSTKDDGSLK